jgi:nitrate reductase NapAB chaperone NapD
MTRTLDALAGVDVHHADPLGRLVITVEARNVDESMERLKEIQRLPQVLMAEMAEYCFEDENS